MDPVTYQSAKANLLTVTGATVVPYYLPSFDSTVTAGGTTGAQTINKPSGTVNAAAATTSLVVTCSYCTVNSIVHCVPRTNDATFALKSVVPGAGSFTINYTAPTAETSIGFLVVNQ
jgi:hypothetical protein